MENPEFAPLWELLQQSYPKNNIMMLQTQAKYQILKKKNAQN